MVDLDGAPVWDAGFGVYIFAAVFSLGRCTKVPSLNDIFGGPIWRSSCNKEQIK